MKVAFPAILLLLVTISSAAQTTPAAMEATTIKRTADFEITGKGDAPAWKNANWLQLSRRKGDAAYETRAKLLYADKGIYALFFCEDEKITASFQEDFADLWTEDVVEIFLWTDTTSALYFEYELSPLNYELPILVPNFEGDFLGWRPWHYEGERRTRHQTNVVRDSAGKPTAWVGEFFIPYALLKPLKNVPPQPGTIWHINMYRVDHDRGNTSWSWKPVKTNFHDYQRFGAVRFE